MQEEGITLKPRQKIKEPGPANGSLKELERNKSLNL